VVEKRLKNNWAQHNVLVQRLSKRALVIPENISTWYRYRTTWAKNVNSCL